MKSKAFVLKEELVHMTLDNILLTAYTDRFIVSFHAATCVLLLTPH